MKELFYESFENLFYEQYKKLLAESQMESIFYYVSSLLLCWLIQIWNQHWGNTMLLLLTLILFEIPYF